MEKKSIRIDLKLFEWKYEEYIAIFITIIYFYKYYISRHKNDIHLKNK